ncbi:MAG: D-aminoacyl-tRNA deacylase [Tissierellia bacterium]|nr:D-aminoacyl-tRNA deacylase [Tissierellia bacterium]
MTKAKKAVYYICDNHDWGYVSYLVWDILKEEGYLDNKVDFTFDGREVYKYTDKKNNEFYFVPTDIALCRDYPRYLSDMNKYFSDFDMSGMVTWHEGANALDKVITVHSIGDVKSGCYGPANPLYMHNLMWAMEKLRKEIRLDFSVVTEATHWSGVYEGEGDPELLLEYPVPIVDIEIGSEPESWVNMDACRVLALSLLHIFDGDINDIKLHNLLCVGGVHFDPNFSEAVHTSWNENEFFGVSHIIANQWLVSGEYEGESGIEKASKCVDAIIGGIDAIVFHDKLKGCYKDVVRALGEKYNVPILKHQALRKPENINW